MDLRFPALFRTLALTFGLSMIQTPAATLEAGSAVAPDILSTMSWVQGAPPAEWEPGKIYLLECWATWCGPCVAVIPHLTALHQKYGNRGLRVIGVSVFEDGREKVARFVQKMGEKMSYPVAYAGRGSAFEKEWLIPADVRAIPRTFVVQEGKILLLVNPREITEPVVEALLTGGEVAAVTLARIRDQEKSRRAYAAAAQAFQRAATVPDIPAMEASLAQIWEARPDMARTYALQLGFAKSDWGEVKKIWEARGEEKLSSSLVMRATQLAIDRADAPDDIRQSIAAVTRGEGRKFLSDPSRLMAVARLHWLLDHRKSAREMAEAAVEMTSRPEAGRRRLQAAAAAKFKESLERGELPSQEEVTAWIKEARESAKGL